MRISDWSSDGCSSALRCVGMSMRGLIHHIDLTVSDKGRSRPFYDAVLGFLGYRRSADNDRGSDWDRDGDPFPSIAIVEARGQGEPGPQRGRPSGREGGGPSGENSVVAESQNKK